MARSTEKEAIIIAFTGHRPDKLGGWDPFNPVAARVRRAIEAELSRARPDWVISGMALGVDQWAAEICVALGIPFVAALPCDDMDRRWPPWARTRHRELVRQAREQVVVSPGPYRPWKMQRRNEWMVDRCSSLIAVFDGSPGGTYNTLEYAAQAGKPVTRLAWWPFPRTS